ncbi:MAG: translational repressor RegA [Ghiorsea sp.]
MSYQDEVISDMLEIEPLDVDGFLKVSETLTRCGVSNMKEKKLWQTAHIFHKGGRYYIAHFMEMMMLDGDRKLGDMNDDDDNRLYTIARLLQEWGLIKVCENQKECLSGIDAVKLYILPFAQKKDWALIPKYTIGKEHFSRK